MMTQGISIGPLDIRFYGLMLLLGVAVGIIIARIEARRRGENPEHIWDIVFWGFLAGIVGARLYHVLDTRNIERYLDNPELIVQIWRGGLGIFGAIVGAIAALVIYARVKRLRVLTWLDIGMPALLAGQAVGRWGNFFNQELFGPPTDLPWGIPIDAERVVADAPQYIGETHFHPLFLYESILSAIGVVVLLAIARRFQRRLRPGDIALGYFIWYPATRFALEFLRVERWEVGALPMAQLISLALIAGAIALLVWRHRQPPEPEGARSSSARTGPRGRRSRRRQRR